MKRPYKFELPGYKKGSIIFNADFQALRAHIRDANYSAPSTVVFDFLASPTNVQEQRSNSVQIDKTMSGWFVSRSGPGIGTLTITGYLIDTKDHPERLAFLKTYMKFAEDNLNTYLEYINVYNQVIEVEGVEYHGFIQNLSLGKSQISPYLYNFTINFSFINSVQNFVGPEESSGSGDTQGSASQGGLGSSGGKKVYNFNSVNSKNRAITLGDSSSNTREADEVVFIQSKPNVSSSQETTKSSLSLRTFAILMGEKGVD